MKIRTLGFWLVFFIFNSMHSLAIVNAKGIGNKFFLESFSTFTDQENRLTIGEIVKLERQGAFFDHFKYAANQGIGDMSYWTHFKFVNNTEKAFQVILENNTIGVDSLSIYIFRGNDLYFSKSIKSNKKNQSMGPLNGANNAFLLDFESSEAYYEIFIKATKKEGLMRTAFVLHSPLDFTKSFHLKELKIYILIGIGLISILIGLILFFLNRQFLYIVFALNIIFKIFSVIFIFNFRSVLLIVSILIV